MSGVAGFGGARGLPGPVRDAELRDWGARYFEGRE